MNPDTGEMKELGSFDDLKKFTESPEGRGFTPLPATGEVLDIRGCKFLVKSYNVRKKEMVLRGISKDEAKFVLMGGKLKEEETGIRPNPDDGHFDC